MKPLRHVETVDVKFFIFWPKALQVITGRLDATFALNTWNETYHAL
jgi:hypothetical protein